VGSQGIFSGTINILEKNLDLRSLKHNLIISNIANKDTPNYKAFDLAVEKEMEKLTDTHKTEGLGRTHAAHFPINETDGDYSDVTVTSSSSRLPERGDGNTVDIEKEMANLAENNLLFETMTILIRKKFQGLKLAIQGGGK
jgi:flagellar basal-body rod protein FlgB